jgi:uncharacterized membrane protein YbhN (UPF0104 family)
VSIARSESVALQRGWPHAWLRSAAVVLPLVAVAAVVAGNWELIGTSAGRLGEADRKWLAASCGCAFLTWVCSATAQQGAVVETLPPGRLLAAQFAASAANHILPAGVGGNAVNLRFLLRRGLPPTRAVAALAVRTCATVTGRLVLLAIVLAFFPGALHIRRVTSGAVLPAHPLLLAAAAALLLGCGYAMIRYAVRLRERARAFLASAATDVRALHRDRTRVAALWGGGLAFPAAHAAVVVTVMRAVHSPVPVSGVVAAYLCASTAAGWLPTPAGLGSLDAALALALVTAGASALAATSAVLGYRLATTWLPLIPGVVVLAVLVRRRDL